MHIVTRGLLWPKVTAVSNVFYFWHPLKSENLRFCPTARPTHPRLTQKVRTQVALDVGIHQIRGFLYYVIDLLGVLFLLYS